MRLCPLCEVECTTAGRRFSSFSDRYFHYGSCPSCGLGLVLDPREDYANLYGEDYYAGRGADPHVDYLREMDDPTTVRKLEWQGLSRRLGRPRAGMRVLDFGCGLGGLPRQLVADGWDAAGYEDEGFARQWMVEHGLPSVDVLEPAAYDIAFAVEVVEHLVDPVPVLRQLRQTLRPGGRLIITTGNLAKARRPLAEWSYASVPEVHVTFWSPDTWRQALAQAGFTPEGRATKLPAKVTQYKILKSLPATVHPLARVTPLWAPAAAAVDRWAGVSDFPDGIVAHQRADTSMATPNATDFFDQLRPPADLAATPAFDRGWRDGDGSAPYLGYVDFAGSAWSDDLEELHEESSRDHFMDVLTRTSLIDAVDDAIRPGSVVTDLGCSTGYLLEDLARRHPDTQLVGVDVVAAGLRKAHQEVPEAALLLADVCDLPIGDNSVAAIVSANMLEHVADHEQALRESLRILVPGGLAAFVVPYGAALYDYYDRFLGHERRYGRGELSRTAERAGFEVLHVGHLGQWLYAPFWLVKKRNRLRRGGLRGAALQAQVERDIAATTNSPIGALACSLEVKLTRRGIALPAGIREIIVLRAPETRSA